MKEIDEIERKVDFLTSGMKLPRKRTRRRVAGIATTLLIAVALIASASLINFYYVQTGTVNVESAIILTGPDGNIVIPSEESISIGGDGLFLAGGTEIISPYTIELKVDSIPMITVYFHIVVTEDGAVIDNGLGDPDGDGLLIEIWDITDPIVPINLMKNGGAQIEDLGPGVSNSRDFEIRITAAENINTVSTYGYTITMDWIPL